MHAGRVTRSRRSAGPGGADGKLVGPQYLALDGKGYLWVTDWGNSRVVRYDLDGKFIQAIAGIDGPTGIAVHEDRLYVSERPEAGPHLRSERQSPRLTR